MAKLTTRTLTTTTVTADNKPKGSALTHNELDSNFLNLETDKLENTTDDFTGTLSIKGSGASAVGQIDFYDNDDSNYLTVKAPATISANYTLTLPTTDGDSGQVLTTDGAGVLTWTAKTVDTTNLADDTTPQLGGDLDVNGQDIVSVSDGDIDIVPNGTGKVKLTANSTMIGKSNTNAFLTTNGTGDLRLTTNDGTNSGEIRINDGTNGSIQITPNGSGTVDITAFRVSSATFGDMPQMRRQTTSQTGYSLEISSDSTSTDIAAGQPGGCFGFTQYSDNYSNYGGNAYYIGSINGVVGDEGTLDGSAGENNNAIRLYTYSDQNAFGLNTVGEFRYATASLMKETLTFDNTSGVITIEAATTNDDLKLRAKGTGNVLADAPFVLKHYTTTERNALTAVEGAIIYNTTDYKAQVYNGTSWIDLH